jgi:hypothetical protein
MNIDLDLADLARRDRLGDTICNLLREDARVTDVKFYGSLANGQADQYSDIDIQVNLVNTSDRAFAEELPDIVRPAGAMLLASWSLGALPDLFARGLYFEDYSVFWHVDIACYSAEHAEGTDLKQMYHWSQIFKIWIDEVSDFLRGQNDLTYLEKTMAKWADVAAAQSLPPAARLSHYLDLCVERARSRNAPCEAFYQRCDALRHACLK